MGVNFPTSFWRNQPDDDEIVIPVGETVITWSKNLYYGEVPNTERNFPFEYDGEYFHQNYEDETTADDTYPTPYFGWYLAGDSNYDGIDYSNRVHREDPFIEEDDGRKLNLFFEADYDTTQYFNWDEDGDAIQDYNQFIQSGNATGSFTLSSAATLQILASGLGERYDGNPLAFDRFQLYVNTTLICKGYAPEDDGARPWDVNHCKFFNAGGTRTPPSYSPNGNRNDLGTSLNDGNEDNFPTDNVVDQYQRRKYVREAARFTGSISLGAGAHTISIYYNTNDGLFNSGAFYGATFSFS